jgi:hypothetical protein
MSLLCCFAPNLSCFQAKKMAAVGAKEETFDVWMKQESDTVQALGMAYAERETIEASYRVIQQVFLLCKWELDEMLLRLKAFNATNRACVMWK